jgi:hypothetical protein
MKDWKKYSRILENIDSFLPYFIEGLGNLSDELIDKFKDIHSYEDDKDKLMVFESSEFLEYTTQSQLWVMGCYEVIRTLDQRAREGSLYNEEIRGDINRAKKYFERIRIPMAKFEPSKSKKDEDYSYPLLWFRMGEGAVWSLNKTTIISRKDLAETFYILLKNIYYFEKKGIF